ncbi:alpha/beta fold hydrolase [Paraburkholderia domus]|uniref:alpha/beta fold hydrolase n=1 Tax=Paraburkholderia domus TaxID=2793075 RepID=UPI001F4170C0|nr:alpha/beta fold hydrolase [Paraburkholderia domus]
MTFKRIAILVLLAGLSTACTTPSVSSQRIERTIVKRGDVRIETISQGKGPVIVILPSLGRSAEDYDEVARLLATDGFRVLRPEPRGIGQSKGPMEVDMHAFAADVASVLDQEKTGPVVVVGHAWGSQPARMLAVDRPDLVRGPGDGCRVGRQTASGLDGETLWTVARGDRRFGKSGATRIAATHVPPAGVLCPGS